MGDVAHAMPQDSVIVQESSPTAQPGDLALLIGRDRKSVLLRLQPGAELHTHHGALSHDELIETSWGSYVPTRMRRPMLLLRPSTDDIVRHLTRSTQIVYPKDAGYILMKMSIAPGCRVVEAGTGSGALTVVLAQAVGPAGHVYSYEIRPDVRNLARKNLAGLGLSGFATLKLRDISEGFDEHGADALFLDLPNPWDFVAQAHAALASGAFFGCILPTANQVIEMLGALGGSGFGVVEVDELFVRPYKATAARLRPMDRMVAHTGYLVFARALA